jgi:hypothetical protein
MGKERKDEGPLGNRWTLQNSSSWPLGFIRRPFAFLFPDLDISKGHFDWVITAHRRSYGSLPGIHQRSTSHKRFRYPVIPERAE